MGRENFFKQSSNEKIDEIKLEICRTLRREIIYSRDDQKEIARRLATSPGNVSRVVNLRIDNLTINQLFRYLAILKPNFKILVATQ